MNTKPTNRFMPYIVLILGILYGIWPIDIIPDIPIVGWVDDLGVLGTAIFIAIILFLKNKQKDTSKQISGDNFEKTNPQE